MDYFELPGKWGKLKFFIEKENRFPNLFGGQEEKNLAEFVNYILEQKNKKISDYRNDSNGSICYILCNIYNKQLDEFTTTLSDDCESSEEEEKSHKENFLGQTSQLEEENSTYLKDVISSIKDEKFGVEQILSELAEKGLSAFSPEFDFIEDENGELELSEDQIKVLERIRLIQNFIDSQEYIEDEDRKILDVDILTQKNLFEQEIKVNRSDNLCKYWDECNLFERNWIDPENPKVSATYFFNFEAKHPEASAPGSMIIGFDVSDNFVPDLRVSANRELFDKLYSFNKYFHRDVMFFVNSQSIYVLRFGSSSDLPVSSEEEIFDDFWKFFNFVTELCTNTYFQGSKELLEFYIDMKTKLEESN